MVAHLVNLLKLTEFVHLKSVNFMLCKIGLSRVVSLKKKFPGDSEAPTDWRTTEF